ncbi:alpha/beta hydrolase [Pseudoxanthomonas sp. SL93]|uniref:alpha/beta fold hydrolase n=1 Tax=Pseudoxanthomonas sp. SL93 TaxID=2995142 RepID=UPI00226D58C6|nr:alpha/beta hydrolase [Pseudoxanthomonas sp. SL93]WAC62526.1 alpha/beta hydrolase [Pseudoxanthomonas sp. SL93]
MNLLTRSLLASALTLAAIAPAFAADAPATDAATPTVVLVHGAFADGSSWNKVIPLLQAKGLKAVAVQNPLTSLEDDVAAANRVIDAQTGPVVLVGHSWAGTVITQAGGHAKVKSLVYVASFAPALGEASVDGVKDHATPPGVAHFIQDAHGYLTLPADAIARDFAQDVSAEEANLIAATQGPVRAANFAQKVTVAAWSSKPSWYIVAAQDRMIDPQAQRALAARMGATTTVLQTSHVPMSSDPQAVADVIAAAARAAK